MCSVRHERTHAQYHLLELVHSSDCLLNRNAFRTMHAKLFGPFIGMEEERERWKVREMDTWKEESGSKRETGIERMKKRDTMSHTQQVFLLSPHASDSDEMQFLYFSFFLSHSLHRTLCLSVALSLYRIVCILFYFNIKRSNFWEKIEKRNVCYANKRSAFAGLKLRILSPSFSFKSHSK